MHSTRPTSILLGVILVAAAAAAFGLRGPPEGGPAAGGQAPVAAAPPAREAAAPVPGAPPSPQDFLADVEKLLDEAESAQPERPPRPVQLLRSGAPEPLSAEHVEQIIAVARDVDPELADRLLEFRAQHPGPRFRRALAQARHLVGLRDLKERDEALYEMKIAQLRLEPQVDQAAAELRQARAADPGSAQVAALEQRLRTLLLQQVGLSIAVRVQYIRLLEQQVQAMKDEVARNADLSAAVDRRMAELLGE